MSTHIGTKLVNASPMTRGQYNKMRGFVPPADENPDDEGYLVEYLEGGKPNHPQFKGYSLWSPKDVFEQAYRTTDAMRFGDALVMLEEGHKVARAGWNGKGMWIALSCNGTRQVQAQSFWSKHNADHALAMGGSATVLPSITMKTATGEILMGWLASQTDMLAKDWQVVG